MKRVTIILTLFCATVFAQYTFTDERDKQKYKTVVIGEQTWMAENLNYNAKGSKCYNNKSANCKIYGRLYDWETAIKACPKSWHLPSKAEWEVLTVAVGGKDTEGKYLKAVSGWKNSGNGTDAVGFSALPGGCGISDGHFGNVGESGHWWSSSENDANRAYSRRMNRYENAYYDVIYKNNFLFSVRCLQD